jgi:hypothetical protein
MEKCYIATANKINISINESKKIMVLANSFSSSCMLAKVAYVKYLLLPKFQETSPAV